MEFRIALKICSAAFAPLLLVVPLASLLNLAAVVGAELYAFTQRLEKKTEVGPYSKVPIGNLRLAKKLAFGRTQLMRNIYVSTFDFANVVTAVRPTVVGSGNWK